MYLSHFVTPPEGHFYHISKWLCKPIELGCMYKWHCHCNKRIWNHITFIIFLISIRYNIFLIPRKRIYICLLICLVRSLASPYMTLDVLSETNKQYKTETVLELPFLENVFPSTRGITILKEINLFVYMFVNISHAQVQEWAFEQGYFCWGREGVQAFHININLFVCKFVFCKTPIIRDLKFSWNPLTRQFTFF